MKTAKIQDYNCIWLQGKWVTTSGSAFTYKPVNVVSIFDDTQAGKAKSHDPEGPTDYIIAGEFKFSELFCGLTESL